MDRDLPRRQGRSAGRSWSRIAGARSLLAIEVGLAAHQGGEEQGVHQQGAEHGEGGGQAEADGGGEPGEADLYAEETMGTPGPIISSLEKIAALSGKSRDLPSWHHFSIGQRVDCLWRSLKDPGLIRRHHRFVLASFLIYLVMVTALGYLLNFSTMKERLIYGFMGKALQQQVVKQPDDIALYHRVLSDDEISDLANK